MTTSRRELFRVGFSGLAAVSVGSTIPAFVAKMAYASPAANPSVSNDNILVVIQLSGGNDGLNTVIPYANDAYYKARPNIGIKDRYLRLNDALALNPGMADFKSLYDAGQLAIINGCGYPKPNRSHFESMHIWHTADPDNGTGNGWLGHYIDHCLRGSSSGATAPSPMSAINIGAELPHALVADSTPVPSIQSIDDYRVKTEDATNPLDAKTEDQIIRDLNAVRSNSPALEFLSRQATNAILSTDQVRKLAAGYHADAEYPYGFGQKLKLIAQLISGQFGTKVFYCETGGFDTHANQPGQHESLWSGIGKAVAAFHKDLGSKGYGGKVTIMCFSEFGRRISQNDSYGTDHGTAGPMFLIGDNLRPGIHGPHPSLTDTDNGDLKYTTDFRRVYATVLDNWLNADSSKVLGNRFEPVAFIKGMKPTTRPSNDGKAFERGDGKDEMMMKS